MNKNCKPRELYDAADKYGIVSVLSMFGTDIRVHIPMTVTLWDTSIDELNLSVRARNGLMRAGTDTIGKVSELIMNDNGLNKVRNLGKKSVSEIKTALLVEGYNNLDPASRLEFWHDFIDNNSI